jgi:hypothetical protein
MPWLASHKRRVAAFNVGMAHYSPIVGLDFAHCLTAKEDGTADGLADGTFMARYQQDPAAGEWQGLGGSSR